MDKSINPRCLQVSVSGGWGIISKHSRESKTGLHLHPLKSIKNWRVNGIRIIFLPQVLDSYQSEALGVFRVNGLESNISKNKHNQGKIISLGIWQDCVLYCTTQYMARYGHIHTYSMLCESNTKDFFSSAIWYNYFSKWKVSW